MPSSYTANGGIRLPASGEESGTWGNIVNTNMEIIDRLTNGVTTISLAGTTHALSTGDGTLSEGQYGVIILGGAPSGTNTITITPNDGQHVYIVKNLSGQDAIFTQGSGSNVSVLNNTTKIIYADGAGAGAAVVDITGALDLGSLIIAGTSVTSTAAELNILDGVTSTAAELNLVDGSVAGTIVNSKAVIYGAAGEVDATTLKIAGTAVTATAAELNYVDGVTSAIQTQMDLKAPLASPTLTTPTLASTITITGGTQSWTAVASGTNLTFSYNGVKVMRVDSSGNLTVIGNVTAYGTVV